MGTGIFSAPDPANGFAQGALFQLEVADPCSGIRSLFALVMLSALYGYLMMRKTWQKLWIFILAIPFAIMGNIARILILTAGTLLFGSDVAIGTLEKPTAYHLGAGYAVFVVAIGMMVFTGWLLERPWQAYWQHLTRRVINDPQTYTADSPAASPHEPSDVDYQAQASIDSKPAPHQSSDSSHDTDPIDPSRHS
jgi:exosortase/archaeosortase family protein